jgi:hypothetical protein
MDKFSRRTVKVTREHNEECRRLLKLMGIPVIVVRNVARYSLPPTNTVMCRLLQRPKLNAQNWHEVARYAPIIKCSQLC